MRLDRVNLNAVADILQSRLREALDNPGHVVSWIMRTSPRDGVQIFLRAKEDGRVVVAIRRPGGKEDPREIEALARHMGLSIVEGPKEEKGRVHRPLIGPRAYLVAVCRLGQNGEGVV